MHVKSTRVSPIDAALNTYHVIFRMYTFVCANYQVCIHYHCPVSSSTAMVRLQLSIRAELENVTDLTPADPHQFDWFFQVKCNSCNEIHPKLVSMNRSEERELAHGKGSSANFVWKCGSCKRESSATFEALPKGPKNKDLPLVYTDDSSSTLSFTPLVTLDCRGLEFVAFSPQGIWQCVGKESRTSFPEVDLSEGEWTDYDEKAALPVSIMNFESQWSRAP